MTTATRGVAVSAFGNLVPPAAALATQPILAHSLGVSGRGEVAAATAPLLLAVIVLALGIPESLTFFVARRAVKVAMSWGSMTAVVLAGAIGAWTIAEFAGVLSDDNDELARLMIIAALAIVPALIVSGLRGISAGYQQWVLIAIERSASASARLVAIAALASTGHLNISSATVVIAVTTFAGGLVYLPVALRFSQDCRRSGEPVPTPPFAGYAAKVWLGATAGIVFSRVDQLLMTPLSSVHQLGIYAVAASVAEVILLSNLAIRDVIFSIESESPDDTRAGRAARISTLVTLLMGIVLAAIVPWGIPALFGAQFAAAVPVTLILIASAVVGNPGSVAGAVLSGRGRPGLRSLSLIIGLGVNVLLVVALVPMHGAAGAAVATFLASLVAGNNLNIVWLRLFFGIPMSNSLAIRRTDVGYLFWLCRGFVVRSNTPVDSQPVWRSSS